MCVMKITNFATHSGRLIKNSNYLLFLYFEICMLLLQTGMPQFCQQTSVFPKLL